MHKRTPWQIQKAVINALYLREMKTRFGSQKLGYLWAVLEPAAIIIAIWAMFGLHLRGGGSEDYPMFLMTGMLSFQLFSKISNSSMNAFQANKGLFNYRQVKPIDTLFTRVIVECLVYGIVFVLFMIIGGQLGFQGYAHDPFNLLLTFVGLIAFSFFFGLTGAVLAMFSETFPKIIGLINRPLFFASGIFFSCRISRISFMSRCCTIRYLAFLSWSVAHILPIMSPRT